MQSFELAHAYIQAIGATGQVIDWRAIHDTNKAIPAIPFRDTLENAWHSIVHYNNQGYGIFATISQMDGNGRELANVAHIRGHVVDLDNLSAPVNFERAANWQPSPTFAVQTSPNKFHVYWIVQPYVGNDRFTVIQRKLRQFFDGDGSVIDATRVLRVPGTLHQKNPNSPHLVQCFSLAGYSQHLTAETLENVLQLVNVVDGGHGARQALGSPDMAAPNVQLLQMALQLADPNTMSRGDWIAFTAAFKQAGYTLLNETDLFAAWSKWCERYAQNDIAENQKQWNSITSTELSWKSIVNRLPGLKAFLHFGQGSPSSAVPVSVVPVMPTSGQTAPQVPSMPATPGIETSGEMLNAQEQAVYFKDCVLIERLGQIIIPSGRIMNATQFNAKFGGKIFIHDSNGKTTDEPWKAATRSTLWTVPKVDHIRFLPGEKYGAIITDNLGRDGLNVYKPAIIKRRDGDVSPFLRHMELIIPGVKDRETIIEFLAHNVKFPGVKTFWAPVIQSVEGVGKGVLKMIIEHAIGDSYVYFPNAKEMIESGSKFNAWLRNKLFILVDEIKVDEKRDMVEILKPMISEERIEIQSKGVDQDKEDNPTNWMFFTNFKDAIPINKNGRRYSIFYSPIQTTDDLIIRGMNDDYFENLYNWLRNGGKEIVANYLFNYPIECGGLPKRAPETSSSAEALRQSRSPLEQLVLNAIEDHQPGFKGGYVSALAVQKRIRETNVRNVTSKTVSNVLEGLGFVFIGRANRAYFAEDASARADIFAASRSINLAGFGQAQGYE